MQKHSFAVLDQKYPFLAIFGQKIKSLNLSLNLVPAIILIWQSLVHVHFYSVFDPFV